MNTDGEAKRQRTGDYLVEVLHIADTGYDNENSYPTDTCSASDARSELWVCVFHATKESSLDWYRDIYLSTNWPDHNTKLILEEHPTIHGYGYHFDVATLIDQQAIDQQMARFKERVKAELGLQL